jgi:hypothetical protein
VDVWLDRSPDRCFQVLHWLSSHELHNSIIEARNGAPSDNDRTTHEQAHAWTDQQWCAELDEEEAPIISPFDRPTAPEDVGEEAKDVGGGNGGAATATAAAGGGGGGNGDSATPRALFSAGRATSPTAALPRRRVSSSLADAREPHAPALHPASSWYSRAGCGGGGCGGGGSGPQRPDEKWPDMVFYIHPDGSIMFFSIRLLDVYPRQLPRVQLASRTVAGLIPAAVASQLHSDLAVYPSSVLSDWWYGRQRTQPEKRLRQAFRYHVQRWVAIPHSTRRCVCVRVVA